VGAAEIGVVLDYNVLRFEVASALDDGLCRKLHHTEEDRQAELALRDHFPGVAMVDAV